MNPFRDTSTAVMRKAPLGGTATRALPALAVLAVVLVAALAFALPARAECPPTGNCEPPPIDTDPPTAALTVSPNPAEIGQGVSFDASASTGGRVEGVDQSIDRYEWNLDGNASNGYELDTGTTSTVNRSYPLAGARSVGVKVTSGEGSDTATRTFGPTRHRLRAPRRPAHQRPLHGLLLLRRQQRGGRSELSVQPERRRVADLQPQKPGSQPA